MKGVRGLALVLAGCGRVGFDYSSDVAGDGFVVIGDGETGPWLRDTSLPAPREQLGLATLDGRIYAIGGDDGVTDGGSSETYFAPLNVDGTIGTWTIDATNIMPACRYRHTGVIVNGFVFVIGGSCAGNQQATVFRAPVQADGSLGGYTTLSPLPQGRRRHSWWVTDNWIFIAGGSNPGYNTVFAGQVDATGDIPVWIDNTNVLPANRYWQSSVFVNGYAYVIGGQDETLAVASTVYYAKVNADGTTDPWQTSPNPLPVPIDRGAAFSANGYLYLVGGGSTDRVPTTAVMFARLNPDGSNEPWQIAREQLPEPRIYHALVHSGRHVYVFGGDPDDPFGGATSTVFRLDL